MTELDELAAVRSDVPPMSDEARAAGRARLTAAMTGPSHPRRRILVPALAAGVALVVAVGGGVLFGTTGDQEPMRAGDVLNRAALQLDGGSEPRPDQFFYFESVNDKRMRTTYWTPVDGSSTGRIDGLDESGDCPPSLLPPCVFLVVESADERLRFPSVWLATLPDTPGALLTELRTQARSLDAGFITLPTPSAPRSADEVVWAFIRGAIGRVTSDQQALLFRVGARLKGMRIYRDVPDAEGRVGIGVGMDDPRTGRVVLVFDPTDYRYLGTVALDRHDPDRVLESSAVVSTGIVDRVGQQP